MKNWFIFILFLVVTGFLLYFLFFYSKIELMNKKKVLLEEIDKLKKEYVFMKFNVLNQTEDTILDFVLYDINGTEVTNFLLTNKGIDVFVESRVIVLKKSNAIVLPLKIYSEVIPPEKGTFIGNYYFVSGEVLLYKSTSRELSDFVNNLYSNESNIKNEYIETSFNGVLHTLNGIKAGKSYECFVHINGGLELREVDYE